MSKSKNVFKVNGYPFFVRQAEQVARAIASTFVSFPSQMSVQGGKQKEGLAFARFRFETGVDVLVRLFNLDVLTESWRAPHLEDWVVYEVEVRHYAADDYHHMGEKETTIFSAQDLKLMHEKRMWHHPHTKDINDICGEVGIFYNTASDDGHIQNDPDTSQEGHYTLIDRVLYRVLVPGDLQRAREEAQQRLDAR